MKELPPSFAKREQQTSNQAVTRTTKSASSITGRVASKSLRAFPHRDHRKQFTSQQTALGVIYPFGLSGTGQEEALSEKKSSSQGQASTLTIFPPPTTTTRQAIKFLSFTNSRYLANFFLLSFLPVLRPFLSYFPLPDSTSHLSISCFRKGFKALNGVRVIGFTAVAALTF